MKILIIDDAPDNADLLSFIFQGAGHEVVTAETGAEGLAAANAASFDAILTDLGLPGGVDGYDVIAAVRNGSHNPRVPLVAVTAYSDPERHRRALDAGCDRVVTKPIVDLPAFVVEIEAMVKAA